MREQQQRRQQDRAEEIDVPERIESDAPEVGRGAVPEVPGDKPVRRLMQSDGDDNGDSDERDQPQVLGQ